MTTLVDLIRQSEEFDTRKSDEKLYPATMRFSPQAQLLVPTPMGITGYAPTDHAWKQLFIRLGPAVWGRGSTKSLPPEYMLNIPKGMLADNVNVHLASLNAFNRNVFLCRLYEGKVRAILGPNYNPELGNTAVLERVARVVDAGKVSIDSFVRSTVTPDDVIVKAISFTPDGGQHGLGFVIDNNETGEGGINVFGLIQRHKCQNSIVISGGERFRHTADPFRVFSYIVEHIREAFRMSNEWFQRFRQAEEMQLPAFSDLITEMATKYGWTTAQATHVAVGTEGSRTVAGIINGITWMAHEGIKDAREQLATEMQAGDLLQDPNHILVWAQRLAADRQRNEDTDRVAVTREAVRSILG